MDAHVDKRIAVQSNGLERRRSGPEWSRGGGAVQTSPPFTGASALRLMSLRKHSLKLIESVGKFSRELAAEVVHACEY